MREKSKVYDTRCSQAVPTPSTILARRCLTSVIGRERVCSSWYGRRQRVLQCLYVLILSRVYLFVKKPWTNDKQATAIVFLRAANVFCAANTKAYGTRSSQAVPHPSTILARRCLTSVIGRERVYSSWYGRRRSGKCDTVWWIKAIQFAQVVPLDRFNVTDMLERLCQRKFFFKVVKIGRSTMLFGLLVTTYSQALSHYCTVRELLPAAFPPWAGTFLIIQPGRLLIPLQSPCWHWA